MIIAKIDEDGFLDTVRHAPTIAFQRLDYGYAVAWSKGAFYAPIYHPGGGNFDEIFPEKLGLAFLSRMSSPHYRTLRPTAKPIPTDRLRGYLAGMFGPAPEVMTLYPKAPGDRPEIVDSECQVVIQAIELHDRPDLQDAMKPAKRDLMSDALDLVIGHAEHAREYCEVGEGKTALIKMHLMQSTTAMKTCLEMLLKP